MTQQQKTVSGIVITTNDQHAFSEDHLQAVRKNLQQFKCLEEIQFIIHMSGHNLQKKIVEDASECRDRQGRYNMCYNVEIEPLKDKVTETQDLGQVIIDELQRQLNQHLVTH